MPLSEILLHNRIELLRESVYSGYEYAQICQRKLEVIAQAIDMGERSILSISLMRLI